MKHKRPGTRHSKDMPKHTMPGGHMMDDKDMGMAGGPGPRKKARRK